MMNHRAYRTHRNAKSCPYLQNGRIETWERTKTTNYETKKLLWRTNSPFFFLFFPRHEICLWERGNQNLWRNRGTAFASAFSFFLSLLFVASATSISRTSGSSFVTFSAYSFLFLAFGFWPGEHDGFNFYDDFPPMISSLWEEQKGVGEWELRICGAPFLRLVIAKENNLPFCFFLLPLLFSKAFVFNCILFVIVVVVGQW